MKAQNDNRCPAPPLVPIEKTVCLGCGVVGVPAAIVFHLGDWPVCVTCMGGKAMTKSRLCDLVAGP